ncbi:MAG: diphthine synthase [Candidatus Woesearchaeota archaeon]
MTLYLIGIGLADEKSISVRGLEMIKQCDKIYLENYTSVLNCDVQRLEQFYGKKIILADRETVEQGEEQIVDEARETEVAFLIIGDVFGATTHVELFRRAKEKNIPVQIINNASILTAVGITGLELYKFGKVTSIPFYQENLETPYNVLKENQKAGLHTLFLLDLNPAEDSFMTVNQALEILVEIEQRKQEQMITADTVFVGCARLGREDFLVKKGNLEELKSFDFGKPPHCLVIPGKLHFIEEEMLELWN